METMKATILLVDDDPALLRLLSMRLTAAGHDVLTADNGEHALAQVATGRPQLMITDLRMDGMDGLALLNAIRQTNSTLPVILLTAHGTIPEAITATNHGAFSFLTKPFDGKQLLGQIDKALSLSGAPAMPHADTPSAAWRQGIVTRSPLMEDLLRQAYLIAASDVSVLIHGESGTGKELLAKAIHLASARRQLPFVPVNSGAIPEPLLESELFGYSKGAFTGAVQNHAGLLQTAHGGTLFLDEIGDMPLALQVKLLRVLEEKQVRPLGSTKLVPVDVRIISATHRDLHQMVRQDDFREDLYYRLNVVELEVPNLAVRREDVLLLIDHRLDQLAAKHGRKRKQFSPEGREVLLSAAWPGNVRQLFNVVEQAYVLSATPTIPATLVQRALRHQPETTLAFADAKQRFERDYLVQLLHITGGNVSQAARLAQRNRTELYKFLHRHQIDPSLFKSPT